MSKSPDPFANIPDQMRAMTEESVSQARKAMDDFMAKATTAISDAEERQEALREGAVAVNQTAMKFAEDNIKSAFDLAERMVAARDAETIMKLQQDYMSERMSTMANQVQTLGEAAGKTATDALKPKS